MTQPQTSSPGNGMKRAYIISIRNTTATYSISVSYTHLDVYKRQLVEPYNLQYRFSADFDWCIRIMKKARTLHNTHLTIIDYLEEGMTTRNQKASLKERFSIMAKHYGLIGTVAHHAWLDV